MEKATESIKSVRSIGQCFRKGLTMYFKSFKKMTNKAWHFAIIHALAFAILLTVFVDYYIPMNNYYQLGIPTNDMALLTVVVILAITFVFGGVIEICVYLSLLRIFSPDKVIKTFFKGLRLCLAHIGTTAAVLCISLLTVLVSLFVFMLPAIVIMIANVNLQVGLLNGDAITDVDNIKWLTFVVYFLSGILKLFITSLPLFVLYYACGSMIAKDEAKTKFRKEV